MVTLGVILGLALFANIVTAVPHPECDYPLQIGNCGKKIPMYYFDGQECKEFFYSGCGNEGNRFWGKESCELACIYQYAYIDPITRKKTYVRYWESVEEALNRTAYCNNNVVKNRKV